MSATQMQPSLKLPVLNSRPKSFISTSWLTHIVFNKVKFTYVLVTEHSFIYTRCSSVVFAVITTILPQNGSSWKRFSPNPLQWISLLKDPNTANDRAHTTSQGNLFQHLIILLRKNSFLTSNLHSLSLKPSPLVPLLQALVKSISPSFLKVF